MTTLCETPMFQLFGPRAKGIGATDAKKIAEGKWLELWREKMGEITGPSDEHIWVMALGKATEPIHAKWFFKQTGLQLLDPGDEPVTTEHAPEKWMFCTPDRWVIDRFCPLEMKHRAEWFTLEACVVEYMPQLQHQMMVTGADKIILSVIRGNQEPVHGTVSRDQEYCDHLLAQEREFWGYMTREERPPALEMIDEVLPELAIRVPVNGRRPYDLGKNNAFVSKAAEYLNLKPYADNFKIVDKEIRELIPDDASIVTGGGLQFKRDARGAYRCSILETNDA